MLDSNNSAAINENDPMVVDPTTVGVAAMLQGHLRELRSIKTAELAWLDRFTVLIAIPIGYLLLQFDEQRAAPTGVLAGLAIIYFALAAWFQDTLRKERRSYYRILRSVVRSQNYLGLFRANFLSEAFADAFPVGMGPNPNRDGTQPYSSFLRRQIYTAVLFLALLLIIVWRDAKLFPVLTLLVLDVLWIVQLFRIDSRELRRESLGEKSLTGSSPDWYRQL